MTRFPKKQRGGTRRAMKAWVMTKNHCQLVPSDLGAQLQDIRAKVLHESREMLRLWEKNVDLPEEERQSASNLAAYLALRRRDLRELQNELSYLGISSLGRCESRVMASLDAVLATLSALGSKRTRRAVSWPGREAFCAGYSRIQKSAEAILGRCSGSRVRIMVTLPVTAATDAAWCREIIAAGVGCVRINCAHDDPEVWLAMIRNVRGAARALKREVRVQMDLTGPRARTSACRLEEGRERAHRGDEIFLARTMLSKKPRAPFETVCSLPEVPAALKPGVPVFFNEGKLGARVLKVTSAGALLKVTQAREHGEKFREDMAINVPGTDLNLDPLTARDREHLDFVVTHADIVAYSFVQRPEDMDALHDEIAKRQSLRRLGHPLGIVAKIETSLSVRNLPDIIVHGVARAPLAVMIARGDLTVELGPVRMAEIQEELLWICEAAHVPVIWATQVLENLAKKGMASRAELTDAAMAERAECVMLNKGPYITEAVHVLQEVLGRMSGHQRKKTATFRQLHAWDHLLRA